MKRIKQILALSLSALVVVSSINAQDVDCNDSIFQADIQIMSAPASKGVQRTLQQPTRHIGALESVVNFAQILTTSALVGCLSAASGLLCNKYEQRYFADSPKLAFITMCLWGLADQALRIRLAEQLSAEGIAVSPVLNGCIGRLASWSAYLGYLDKYIYIHGFYAKSLDHADAIKALAYIRQNNNKY